MGLDFLIIVVIVTNFGIYLKCNPSNLLHLDKSAAPKRGASPDVALLTGPNIKSQGFLLY